MKCTVSAGMLNELQRMLHACGGRLAIFNPFRVHAALHAFIRNSIVYRREIDLHVSLNLVPT